MPNAPPGVLPPPTRSRHLRRQGGTKQAFEVGVGWRGVGAPGGSKALLRFLSSKAKAGQSEQHPAGDVVSCRRGGVAVGGTVSVKELKAGVCAACDPKVASMMSAMVSSTQRY